MTGAPLRMARSMILQIFWALDSESEPPKTVKSCAKTYTRRPSMRPKPVTKPSPAGRCDSMPKSMQWWRTNLSSSSNVPSSRSRLMRSRAVSLPALCSRSRRSGPPPASASALRRRNSSMRSLFGIGGGGRRLFLRHADPPRTTDLVRGKCGRRDGWRARRCRAARRCREPARRR